MNKKAIVSFAALVCVLALVIVALVLLKKPSDIKENLNKANAVKSLSNFSYLDISGVDIQRPGELLKLRQSNQLWILEDDPSFDLDQNSAVSVATNCSYLSAEESVDAKSADLGALGLNPAQYTVVVYLKDGSTATFLIGLHTIDKKGRYAMVQGGDKIVVIPDYADKAFTTAKKDMINRSVGSIDWAQFAKLEIKKPGEADLVIELNKDSAVADSKDIALSFLETSPYKSYASPELMTKLFTDLPQLSFDAFVATSSDSTYGLDAPRLSLCITDKKGNQLQFNIGNSFEKDGEVFYYCNRTRDPQNVFSLSEKNAEFSTIMPLGALDSLPLPQRTDEIPKKISIAANGQTDVIDIVNSDVSLNGIAQSDEESKALLTAYYKIRIASSAKDAVKTEAVATVTVDFGTRIAKVDFYPYDEDLYVIDQGMGLSVCVFKDYLDAFLHILRQKI